MDLHSDLRRELSLPDTASEKDIVAAVSKLKLRTASADNHKANKLVDDAIKDMRITATEKEFYLTAARNDFDATEKHLTSLRPYRSIESLFKERSTKLTEMGGHDRTQWTLNDWRKHDPNALRKDPVLYKRLLEAQKGTEE